MKEEPDVGFFNWTSPLKRIWNVLSLKVCAPTRARKYVGVTTDRSVGVTNHVHTIYYYLTQPTENSTLIQN